jgi:hypothetical protein
VKRQSDIRGKGVIKLNVQMTHACIRSKQKNGPHSKECKIKNIIAASHGGASVGYCLTGNDAI